MSPSQHHTMSINDTRLEQYLGAAAGHSASHLQIDDQMELNQSTYKATIRVPPSCCCLRLETVVVGLSFSQ